LKAFFISGSLTSISADATATSLVKNQRNNSPPILQANHCEQVCPAQTHPASKQVRMRVFLDWQECYSVRNCRARRFVSRVGEKKVVCMPKTIAVRIWQALILSGACGLTHAAGDGAAIEKSMLLDCTTLAKAINLSNPRIGIDLRGITPLVTWRASCAEKPPTGPGNVTALCEAAREPDKGRERVFFWQKSVHGKHHQGYYFCEPSTP